VGHSSLSGERLRVLRHISAFKGMKKIAERNSFTH
jgi:hypothetical protein